MTRGVSGSFHLNLEVQSRRKQSSAALQMLAIERTIWNKLAWNEPRAPRAANFLRSIVFCSFMKTIVAGVVEGSTYDLRCIG